MPDQQEMIDVFVRGVLVTTVPKSAERDIQKYYNGKPEARVLSIVPHGFKNDPNRLKSIVSKLKPD